MNYYERKELISEKRKLTNSLKCYNNENDWHCLMAELLVRRILKIQELLKR